MKNWIAPGDSVVLVAPADGKSGDLVSVGNFAGVAASDHKAGEDVVVALSGIFRLPAGVAALAQGDPARWDLTNKIVTPAGTITIGVVVSAKLNGVSETVVRLVPSAA